MQTITILNYPFIREFSQTRPKTTPLFSVVSQFYIGLNGIGIWQGENSLQGQIDGLKIILPLVAGYLYPMLNIFTNIRQNNENEG
jgi:hypothetical protein